MKGSPSPYNWIWRTYFSTFESKNLTQEQLGELMGVKRAQISKIEIKKSVTFSTIIRAFKAMGVNSANLDLGSLGKVALW